MVGWCADPIHAINKRSLGYAISGRQKISMHEMIQSYFKTIYDAFKIESKQSIPTPKGNEIYGELYYQSVVKLLEYVKLDKNDHFLDMGFGLGKIVFQVYFVTDANVMGVEINPARYKISRKVKKIIKEQLPDLFANDRQLKLIKGNFLDMDLQDATVIYMASTVFSFKLLRALAEKINNMPNVRKVVSLRKLPNLKNFELNKKIFLQASWGNAPCYLYERVSS